MKKIVSTLFAVFASLVLVTTVYAWDPGIQPFPICSGVKVSVLPRIVKGASLGQEQERWVPYSTVGQTFVYWQGKSHLSGIVIVKWKKQVSTDFGMTWRDVAGSFDIGGSPYHWQADRPSGCKPFRFPVHPKPGDPPGINKNWPRYYFGH